MIRFIGEPCPKNKTGFVIKVNFLGIFHISILDLSYLLKTFLQIGIMIVILISVKLSTANFYYQILFQRKILGKSNFIVLYN
ncbi:hypothetical protein FF021_14985 [Leptospira noguchii]|nr:hypothetical protein FF021_14985 [Leptospira noguchii]